MTDDFHSLTGLLDAMWRRLSRATESAEAPARNLALATSRPISGAAVRLVILRHADRARGTITIHTHARSDKMDEIARDPRAELLLWDPSDMYQARMSGTLRVEPADASLWQDLSGGQRFNYAEPIPGTPLEDREAFDPTPDPALMARLTLHLDRLDLLHLGDRPHGRAIYTRQDDWRGNWVAP